MSSYAYQLSWSSQGKNVFKCISNIKNNVPNPCAELKQFQTWVAALTQFDFVVNAGFAVNGALQVVGNAEAIASMIVSAARVMMWSLSIFIAFVELAPTFINSAAFYVGTGRYNHWWLQAGREKNYAGLLSAKMAEKKKEIQQQLETQQAKNEDEKNEAAVKGLAENIACARANSAVPSVCKNIPMLKKAQDLLMSEAEKTKEDGVSLAGAAKALEDEVVHMKAGAAKNGVSDAETDLTGDGDDLGVEEV